MLLKALELQGFKSFPDKTTLEFGKGITAVIGPNGSGKSNISDAVRWVLGEQSSKSLRGSKMEDVIFGGTSLRKAMGFAEVTLRLDNADRTLNNCDKDEVSVTRRYYRSGESEYQLNGETVRLRDIHELFMDTGLGRDGYSMVSQGRVADLISSRSPQRRDMLEEAAGISHFRYRRADATRRLEQAEENLVRLRDILTELEGRVGPLKTQSEKAQKFLVLAGEKKELEIGLWLKTIERSREGLRAQEDKISLAAADYEQAERELERISAQIEELMSTGSGITVQIEELRTKAASDEEQATAVDGRIAVERNNLSHNRETIERIQRDMEAATATEQHLDDQITVAEKEIAEINGQIENCRLQLLELLDSTGKLKEQESAITAERDSAEAQAKTVNEALSAARIEQSTARSSAEEIAARMSTVDEVIASRGGLLDALREQAEVSRKNLDACLENIESLSNSIDGYSMIVRSRAEKAEKLRRELDAATLDIHQKQARIRMLEDLEKNMEGYSGSVKAVMREAKRATLRGIHGPVSQLITVDAKYAAAVETALGAAVQNIVTDDEAAAKRAIAYLKESRAGRATFLPLTAIRGAELREDVSGEYGFVGVASRLVQHEAQYDNIFRDLLGRTVVVEDLDSGIAMARKYRNAFRIVTLDGQVINRGGSMTGGSVSRSAGVLSRANELGRLTEKQGAMHEKLRAAAQQAEDSQRELQKAEYEVQVAKEQQHKAEAEVLTFQTKQDHYDILLDSLRLSCETMEQELSGFERRAGEDQARIREVQAAIDKAESDAAALRREAQEKLAGQTDLNDATNRLAETVSRKKAEQAALLAEKDAALRGAEDLRRVQADMAADRAGRDQLAARFRADNEQAASDIAAHQTRIDELTQQAETLREKLEKLAQEKLALEAQREQQSREGRQLNEALLNATQAESRLRQKLEGSAMEESQLLDKLWERYELSHSAAQEQRIELESVSKATRRIAELNREIKALGTPNLGAIEEFQRVNERYTYLSDQRTDVEKAKEELTGVIDQLTVQMTDIFGRQFKLLNESFQETFLELFGGGKAQLELEDESDILNCGIEIRVQPPGKQLKTITLLSGGEKAFVAIALYFAILKVHPTPFCVMDEIEAALDEANVVRYARYMRRIAGKTQFIVITHRRGTMEEADVLYGVTMQEKGVSRILTINLNDMAKELKIK